MIIYITLIALFMLDLAVIRVMCVWKKALHEEITKNQDRIIKCAEHLADLSNRMDSVEDYVRAIKSETENDKHADYWASVMNYNPLLQKGESK